MTTTMEAKLARLKNYATRYELAMTRGSESYLVTYATSRSRGTIFKAVARFGPKVVALTGDEELHFARKSADGATTGEWTIRYTGRTQRDAILGGELPFIGDLP
jgi:TnpA family transposase